MQIFKKLNEHRQSQRLEFMSRLIIQSQFDDANITTSKQEKQSKVERP